MEENISKLYPGLTEQEAQDVADGKVSYKDAISNKMAKENIDKKEIAKNSLLYEYLNGGDALLKVMYEKANKDDEIITEGRKRIAEMGLKNSDYTDDELISMYKEKHGNEGYVKTLNGDTSFLERNSDVLGMVSGIAGVGAGIYGARKGVQGVKAMIPTTGKYRDVYKYIANNIINSKTSIKPEYIDKKIMNVVDYFANLKPESAKSIKGNKIGQIRGLYNQLVSDLSTTFNESSKIKQANAGVTFGEEILEPINKEIARLKSVGDISDKYKSLVETKNEVTGLLKKNGGKLNLNDVDLLKEIAYENYDFTKQSQVAADAKAIQKGYANKLLGQGIKTAQDTAIPELKPRNESYGKLKDITKSVGLETNKLSKMTPYTKIGELRATFGKTIGGVPGISAASNIIEGDLPLKKIEEANLGKIIDTAKRFAPKIKSFIGKYGSAKGVADLVKTSGPAITKGAKAILEPASLIAPDFGDIRKRTTEKMVAAGTLPKDTKIPERTPNLLELTIDKGPGLLSKGINFVKGLFK